MSQIAETVALLRESGPWSDEFDSIRLPLADLLERIAAEEETWAQLGDQLDPLVDALQGMEYAAYAPLELWLINSERTLNSLNLNDGKGAAIRSGISRIMNALGS